jgi:hypothetical protein
MQFNSPPYIVFLPILFKDGLFSPSSARRRAAVVVWQDRCLRIQDALPYDVVGHDILKLTGELGGVTSPGPVSN